MFLFRQIANWPWKCCICRAPVWTNLRFHRCPICRGQWGCWCCCLNMKWVISWPQRKDVVVVPTTIKIVESMFNMRKSQFFDVNVDVFWIGDSQVKNWMWNLRVIDHIHYSFTRVAARVSDFVCLSMCFSAISLVPIVWTKNVRSWYDCRQWRVIAVRFSDDSWG